MAHLVYLGHKQKVATPDNNNATLANYPAHANRMFVIKQNLYQLNKNRQQLVKNFLALETLQFFKFVRIIV